MPKRDLSDLLTKLRSQVGFLERSCEAYDKGHLDEGEQLALRARVLLHDTSSSKSLLGLLGVKAAVRFTDTSLRDTGPKHVRNPDGSGSVTVTAHAGLVHMAADLGPGENGVWTFRPELDPEGHPDRTHPPIPFKPWWETPFLTPPKGTAVTRSKLVRDVANKDGGAHIDEAITMAYAALRSGEALPLKQGGSAPYGDPITGFVMATMRQIAWELMDTLYRDLPNCIDPTPWGSSTVLTPVEKHLPRTGLCPCGSGQELRHCHGA